MCLSLSLSSSRGLSEVPLIPGQRIQPLKVEGYCRDDLSYNYTHSLHTHTHTRTNMHGRLGVQCEDEQSKMADSNVQQDYCTHHPQISNLHQFISFRLCLFKWMAPDICQGEGRAPHASQYNQPIFPFFRSASLLLLSVQFQHLEVMPKSKASRNVREISLINATPLHSLLPVSSGFVLLLMQMPTVMCTVLILVLHKNLFCFVLSI